MSAIPDTNEQPSHAPRVLNSDEINDKYTPRSVFEYDELPIAKPRNSVKIKPNPIDIDDVRDYPTDDQLAPAEMMPIVSSEQRQKPITPRQSTKYRSRIQSEGYEAHEHFASESVSFSGPGRHEKRMTTEFPIQHGQTIDFTNEFESEKRQSAWDAQNIQQYQRRKSVPTNYPTSSPYPMIHTTSPRQQKARIHSPYGDIESDHSDSDPKPAARLSTNSVTQKSRNSLRLSTIKKEKQLYSTTDEKDRIKMVEQLGILGLGPLERVDKITKLAATLLRKPICVFSVVGADKVTTKSLYSNEQEISTEEPRYQSLCSWVVQDEYGSVAILDTKRDPRCTHMKLKAGLEFYLGVPVVFREKFAIGTLSVRGPASTQCPDQDVSILQQMSQMISLELEYVWTKNMLRDSQAVLDLQNHIKDQLSDSQGKDHRIIEKTLAVMNQTYRSSCTMILKLSEEVTGFQSHLQAYAVASNFVRMTSLSIGKELLRDLAILALLRQDTSQALTYVNHQDSKIRRELEHYFTKPIGMCVAECMYTSCGPYALVVSCFEDYKTLSDFELEGYSKVATSLSKLYQQIEVRDSLVTSQKLFKDILNDFNANNGQDLYPIVVVMQAVIPAGTHEQNSIQMNGERYSMSPECFETLNDFTQIINSCSEKSDLKKPKKYGNYYCIMRAN
jgi:hypothetical protein